MCEGIYDSVRNIFVIFYLDREMNKKFEAKAERASNIQALDVTKKINKEKKKE